MAHKAPWVESDGDDKAGLALDFSRLKRTEQVKLIFNGAQVLIGIVLVWMAAGIWRQFSDMKEYAVMRPAFQNWSYRTERLNKANGWQAAEIEDRNP